MRSHYWLKLGLLLTTSYLVIACGAAPSARSPQAQGDCRLIRHAVGETCVPEEFERVMALDPGSLGNSLALGVTPIATTSLDGEIPEYLSLPSDVAVVGHPSQPNLERILGLNPDLILMDNRVNLYEPLSQIAPTVVAENWQTLGPEPLWKRDFKFHAKALGKSETGAALLEEYNQRVSQLQDQLGDGRQTLTVSVVNVRSDHVRVYLKDSFIGTILEDVGLSRPPLQDRPGLVERISLEVIPELDADVMFLIVSDSENTEVLDQFTSHPLWSQLSVVQRDRVYSVPDETWINGWNLLGVHDILDDLSETLVPVAEDS